MIELSVPLTPYDIKPKNVALTNQWTTTPSQHPVTFQPQTKPQTTSRTTPPSSLSIVPNSNNIVPIMPNPHLGRQDLPNLQRDLLTALKTQDPHGLTNFERQFSKFVLDFERDIPINSLSADELKAHYCFSHNVCIASTLAQQVQLAMDEICDDFSQQLSFLAPLADVSPAASSPPSKEPVVEDNGSPSTSHTILKNWSQTRLSYLFPSPLELKELVSHTSMSETKLNSWFRNARSRSGWAKLYALKPDVNKNQEKLQSLIDEYQSLKRLNTPEEFKKIVAAHETYQLLEKIFKWFATTKETKAALSTPKAVKPWIKDVLSSTLSSLKQGATGVLDSSKQLLPSFSSRGTTPSSTTTSSPTASSPHTASTAPTSVASSSSDRSDSPELSPRPASLSTSSSSPVISSPNLLPAPSSIPNPPCTELPADLLKFLSNLPKASTSSHSPAISLSQISPEPLPPSNPACDLFSAASLASSSSLPAQPSASLEPALLPSALPPAPSACPIPWNSSRPAPCSDSSSRPSSSSSMPSSVVSFTSNASAPAGMPASADKIYMHPWVNPLLPRSARPSRSGSSGSLQRCEHLGSVSPFFWNSPEQSPFASPRCQASQLPQKSIPSAQPPFQFVLPQTRPIALTILSSSPTEPVTDERPSSSHPSISSALSKKTTQSCLSGQFDDAPEDL
ncbi:hypothetical protein PtA15_3A274 [Puccinia triticina]|uniref:KN homeodomain domain-containing protein n=1 Tax=Puccinia triticina TaxID=208348 RepID=A0ABY7CCX6_9BASI|nr:uncharacterized protein PtA15_3A274 [Puccinia triticina]WAQ82909.1 hypothetical protein PtA15_3A274 [Puccinia triticina]